MEVKKVSKDELNNFVYNHPQGSLLQTWEWGDFQEVAGFKTWRLGVFDDEYELAAVATIFKYDMPLGKWYLYCPRGPLYGKSSCVGEDEDKGEGEDEDNNNEKVSAETLDKLFKVIEDIAKEENCIFFEFEPLLAREKLDEEFSCLPLKFSTSVKEVQPKDTILLDLTKPEDEILKQMKPKTRYNIRLAGRKGVVVKQRADQKAVGIFYKIAEQTQKRDGFSVHKKEYYEKLVEALAPAGHAKVFIAEFKGKPIAANIILFYKDTAVYSHGASSNEHRNIMAPHLLQWEAIKEAKKRGMKFYDFGGVAPEEAENHSWAGITRFKEGFGGKRISYAGPYAIVYNNFWFSLYKLAKSLKK